MIAALARKTKRKVKSIQVDLQEYSNYLKTKRQPRADSKYKETSTGEETYRIWHNRIDQTLNWRMNHWNGPKNWDRAYELYKGDHWESDDMDVEVVKSDNRRDKITVNLTGSSIQNMVPFLMSSRASFICKATKPDGTVGAELQTAVLNYEYDQRGMQEQLEKAVLDCVIMGHGVTCTGFTLEIDEAVRKVEGEIDYRDYIKKESPFVRRVSPYMFLFDPTASEHNLATSRWCAEIIFSPIKDILANSNYLKKTIASITSGEYSITTKQGFMNPDVDMDDNELGEEDELGVLYQLYDKKYRKYYLFAAGVLEPLIEKPWPYQYLDGFPYEMVNFVPVPDCHYAMGLALAVEDQQLELNAVRSRMFAHGRRFNRKYQVLDTVNEEETDKLADGADGTIVVVPQIGAVAAIQDAPLSQDHQLIEAMIKQDFQSLTSQDALIQGGNLPSRTTAGEVNTRGSLFRMKLDTRVASVDRFVLANGKQTLQHIKYNFLTPKVIQITGASGQFWQEYTVEDIQDDVDVTMESIAAPKIDPILDRQQSLQLFQMIMGALPVLQQLQIPFDYVELFKWMFNKIGDKEVGRFFKPFLTPNAPMVESSNNLNNQLPQPNTNVQSTDGLQKQNGIGALLNASGLQV